MMKSLKGKTIKDCSWRGAEPRTGVITKVFQTAGRVAVEWSTGKTTEVAISKIHDKPERTTGYFVTPKASLREAMHESHGGAAVTPKQTDAVQSQTLVDPAETFTENAPAEMDANNVPHNTLDGQDPSDA